MCWDEIDGLFVSLDLFVSLNLTTEPGQRVFVPKQAERLCIAVLFDDPCYLPSSAPFL